MTGRTIQLQLEVNGTVHALETAPMRRLLDVLRDDLRLTGTKESCSVGVCGACAVLLDGQAVSACLLPVALAVGRSVTTIEGLASPDGELSAVQEAFVAEGGFQCGICTPGQVIAATALLAEHPNPTDDEIVGSMAGNLCRCTGYGSIRRAVAAAVAAAAATTRGAS